MQLSKALLLCCAIAPFASGASADTFHKLADTTLVAPDGLTVFTLAPPQQNAGTVVFMAATGTPNAYIYSIPASGGTPTALVSLQTKVPGGTGTFTGNQAGYFSAFSAPNCPPPVVGAKSAVFVGNDSAGNRGIYSVPLKGGKVVKLVDYNTPIPGGPVLGNANFNNSYSFCNISVSGNTVVFDGGSGGVYSVLTDGQGLTRIADPNTPITIPPFTVNGFSQPSISHGQITYVGSTVFGPYAILVGTPAVGHAIALATSSPPFAEFTYPTIGSGNIIFSAQLTSPNKGLFHVSASGGTITDLVDMNSKLPPGTPGTSFSNVGGPDANDGWAADGGIDIFGAQTTDGTNTYGGLFTSCKRKLGKLLTQGDLLDGHIVTPQSGISNLTATKTAGATSHAGAILVSDGRYVAVYEATVPGC